MKIIKENLEVKECTFQPNINKRSQGGSNQKKEEINQRFAKLYHDSELKNK